MKYCKKPDPQFCDETVICSIISNDIVYCIMTYTLRPLLTSGIADTKINLALVWQLNKLNKECQL